MKNNCRICDLCLNSTNQPSGEHGGDGVSQILFLYDSPSKTQDKHNSVFAGRHMKKFKDSLESHKLLNYSYHTHIMKCRPYFSEIWRYHSNELANYTCSSIHLAEEFKDVKKDIRLIVPVGRFAYQFITGIAKLHSTVYDKVLNTVNLEGDTPVFPINDINTLIKEGMLDVAMDKVKAYYGYNINPKVLF